MLSTDQNVLPDHAEKIAEFQPRRDFGVNFQEADLTLLDADYSVYWSADSGQHRFDVTVDHPDLDGIRVVELLNEIAPAKEHYWQSAGGIIGDWFILDDPQLQRDIVGFGIVKDLVEMHRRLGTPWNEFAMSQPNLIDVLRDSEPVRINERDRPLELVNYASARHREQMLIHYGVDKLEIFINKLQLAGIPDTKKLVMNALAKASFNKSRKHRQLSASPQNEAELNRRYNSAPIAKRIALMKKIYGTRLTDLQREAILEVMAAEYEFATFNNELVAAPKNRLEDGTTLKDALTRTNVKQSGAYEYDVIEVPLKGSSYMFALPGTVRQTRPLSVAKPHIAWTVDDDGGRTFKFERDTYQDQQTRGLRHTDGVLGALVLAYIQPEARISWPRTMRIGQRDQKMEAAQVPVLALMKKRDLLNSTFVEAAEAAL